MSLYLEYYVIWRTNSKQLNKVRYLGKDLKYLTMTASAFNYYIFADEGKKQFENLKKHYSKKRNNLKKKSASGVDLPDGEAAKRDLSIVSWHGFKNISCYVEQKQISEVSD